MDVICVIADVVASRASSNRSALQQVLNKTFRSLNARHKDLLSPYTLTLGDEFQAVYQSPARLFSDFTLIQHAIHPHKVRFSVAIGLLSTPVNPKSAMGMDGPAFHQARSGISEMKKNSSLLRVDSASSAVTLPPWINLSLELISRLQAKWKQRRFYILHGLLLGSEIPEIVAATRLSSTAVYKNVQIGAIHTIIGLYREIALALADAAGKK